MTDVTQKYACHQLVSLSKFDTSIERVIDRMWKVLRGKRPDTLLPTLIGIEVEYNNCDPAIAVPAVRSFLDKLINLRHKHFFRFITDTQWAMESKNGHIFYTHDGPKEARCDAVWIVRVMNLGQVEIQLRTPVNNPRHGLVFDLSNNLKKMLHKPCGDSSTSTMHALMYHCYNKTRRLYQTKHLDENFHVLLTPTLSGNGFHPIPISGMSYFDARRHFKRVLDQVAFQKHTYYEIFNKPVPNKDIMYSLMTMIMDTHRIDHKVNIAQERYALAEMLFGMWATYHECTESKHDMILMNVSDHLQRQVDVFRYSMDMMHEAA
jgi:hypothetical protein